VAASAGLVLVAAPVLVVAVAGSTFFLGMRRNVPVVLRAVRRLNRRVRPLAVRSAGAHGAKTSIVRHLGRRSGRTYETPVVVAPLDDGGFAIALPYGAQTEWVKNVLAAGRATIVVDGEAHEVDQPRLAALAEAGHRFAARERRLHRQFKVEQALVFRAAGARR
jgi:deazaflavin-dependent oxidoreductase (nitroreductase family)